MIITLLLIAGEDAWAFGLAPTGANEEKTVVDLKWGFWRGTFGREIANFISTHFTSGVHEEVTHRTWGCEPPPGSDPRQDKTCLKFAAIPRAVVYGVQWNDNPPFKLDITSESSCTLSEPIRFPDRQPRCWQTLFYDAAKRAPAPVNRFTQRSGHALLYRSHFGDLQFLHSMASWDGEKPRDTKASILMWAEFTYKVAQGDITPTTKLSAIQIAGFQRMLGKYWSDVAGLFTYGVQAYAAQVPDVAFGSLLHMVQDSFSTSHVRRDAPAGECAAITGAPRAGLVKEFYAYNSQNPRKHGERDARNWMRGDLLDMKGGNVVDVGRALKTLRDQRAPWESVRAYLDRCVYDIDDEDLDNAAGPGPFAR